MAGLVPSFPRAKNRLVIRHREAGGRGPPERGMPPLPTDMLRHADT
jgi:hypothetical protein